MRKSMLRSCVSAAALAVMAAGAAPAYAADEQDAAASSEEDPTGLDVIVVTASGRNKAQIDSSISVTSVTSQLIEDFKPSSEAELLRMIPGIQVAGTSGPGGNSNIAVRGLPVATGGAPFVQLQEDGLPVVLFGDIQFGNNDYWTRFDASVASVEGVRGGTAATFASQAPGAVINYISHDGAREGGYLQLNKGLGFQETRADFRYGGDLTDTIRFHVGGFFKSGRGPLRADYNVSESIQIKANLTKDFDDGKGYIRFLFKYADTQEPNYTGAPALATLSGGKVTSLEPYPGFDGRRGSNYSIYNQNFLIVNREGALESVEMSGITTNAKALQAQLHYEFTDNITVDNNMRWTSMNGAFTSPFLSAVRRSSIIGSTVNGGTVAQLRYASGPNAGQVYTGTYVDNNVNVRTNIRDIGSFANDFTIAADYDMAGGKLTARAGWFFMNQKIEMDWHVNKSYRELSGDNPSQLDLFTAAGARLTANGIAGFNNNWGDCCARDYELSYTDNAPYVGLDLDTDSFAIDASARFEMLRASGYAVGGSTTEFNTPVSFNGITTQIPTINATGTREVLNYGRNYTTWTAGALFKASPDTSLFARVSRGGRFNADRQTLSGKFTASGALNLLGQTPSVDFVKQYELGLKHRGDLGGGRYTFELTLLKGDFKRSDYEPTTTAQCPTGGCVIDTKYRTSGAEMFATYTSGGFNLVATATYTKAKRAAAASTVFSRADGIPDLSYTVSANYDIADIVTVGVSATGQTNAIDGGGIEYPGKAVFNGVVRVRPIENLELGIQVYNLFDTFDFRGAGGISDNSVNPVVLGGAPALGRTATVSARFSF
jgi:outer membrane receptor protein involved in Fe transport